MDVLVWRSGNGTAKIVIVSWGCGSEDKNAKKAKRSLERTEREREGDRSEERKMGYVGRRGDAISG